MGLLSNWFGGGGEALSWSERKKQRAIQKAAQKPQRGGVWGKLVGPDTGPAKKEYRHLVDQDIKQLRQQRKYADEKRERAWRIDDEKWKSQKDRYFGISSREKQIASLRDQIRKATNQGQTELAKRLDHELGRHEVRLGSDRRLMERQRSERMFYRKRMLDRENPARDIEERNIYRREAKQFREGVKDTREEMARQKRIQELQQMQSGIGSQRTMPGGGVTPLARGKKFDRFNPLDRGGSSRPTTGAGTFGSKA